GGGDAGRQRRLSKAGPAHDDREPPLGALEQARFERGPGDRPDGIGRWKELGRPAPPRARAIVTACGRTPGDGLRRWLGDGVGVGGHRFPCETSSWYRPQFAANRARRVRAARRQRARGKRDVTKCKPDLTNSKSTCILCRTTSS